MRVLILTPVLRLIQPDRLKDAAPGYDILTNTVLEGPNIIAVVDAQHESNIPARWPERIVVIGDTLSSFQADIRLPLEKAQGLLEAYLATEVVEEEDEEEDGVGGS